MKYMLTLQTSRISIHAPAKGATLEEFSDSPVLGDFNPRSREGSDRPFPATGTFPHHFNPRSREGSDANIIQYKTINSKIFQTI